MLRSTDNTTAPSSGLITIEADALGPDRDVLDRYIAFSSELLRLALAGMAGVGFLVASIGVAAGAWPLPGRVVESIWWSLSLLVTASGFALVHRYIATDALACHVRLLRIEIRGDAARATSERQSRNARLKLSGWLLGIAALALIAGTIALMLAMLRMFSVQGYTAAARRSHICESTVRTPSGIEHVEQHR